MNVTAPSQANGTANGVAKGTTNGVANGTYEIPDRGLKYTLFGNWKSNAKKKDHRQRALEIIEERLPKMTRVAGLLELDLSLDSGPIFIDTRSKPNRILQECADTPDCRVKVKPEYVISFYEGKLEPRYALFKDGFFDETTLPRGDIKVAVKFADALCPRDPVHPEVFHGGRLPVPTEDIDQVKADMKEFGYGLVKNALSPEQVSMLGEAIRQQGRGEVEAGVAARDGGPNAPNQRIWTLINKGQIFHDLLEHPLIDEVVPDVLGEHYLIHSYSANIARPGNTPMMLHTDQVGIQPPVRDVAFGLNIMWFLTDVTRENGGTGVFPGSHIGPIAPDDPFKIDGTVAAEGPAGTALVFESRLWHATGPNTMTSGERPVILLFFMRSYIRQQENNFLSIRPEVEATMSDRVRRMLGYMTDGAFGGVEGEVREGHYVKRLTNPVGPFRDTHKHCPFRQDLRASNAARGRTAELSGNKV